MKRERKGTDAEPEMDAHLGDEVVDPTGHVSSGLQTRPLRGAEDLGEDEEAE